MQTLSISDGTTTVNLISGNALYLAAGGWPTVRTLLLIVLCMVSARSAAMAFNRYADADHRADRNADADPDGDVAQQRGQRWGYHYGSGRM